MEEIRTKMWPPNKGQGITLRNGHMYHPQKDGHVLVLPEDVDEMMRLGYAADGGIMPKWKA